jgi:hypothetical protein
MTRKIAAFVLILPIWIAAGSTARSQPRSDNRSPVVAETSPFRTRTASSQTALKAVSLETMSPQLRERVKKVMSQPTLVTSAPVDEFRAAPNVYSWLFEHPDRVALAWQRRNVPCTPIYDRGQGRFGWSDGEGSDITWITASQGNGVRVWYAEGIINPGRLLPNIPVKAVVIVRHQIPNTGAAVATIRHQADLFMQTDSRAANLAAKLVGPSADRMAQDGAEQLMMFFSGIARHLAEHPDQAEKLLAPAPRTSRATGGQ